MKMVADLLRDKGDEIWSVVPETAVYDALVLLAEKGIGAVLVLRGETLAGIFSERDYARRVILKGLSSREVKVSEIMTRDVVCVKPTHSIDECMALMTERRCRHLPVLVDGRLRGVLSIGDVVKAVLSEKEFQIGQLEAYITQG